MVSKRATLTSKRKKKKKVSLLSPLIVTTKLMFFGKFFFFFSSFGTLRFIHLCVHSFVSWALQSTVQAQTKEEKNNCVIAASTSSSLFLSAACLLVHLAASCTVRTPSTFDKFSVENEKRKIINFYANVKMFRHSLSTHFIFFFEHSQLKWRRNE